MARVGEWIHIMAESSVGGKQSHGMTLLLCLWIIHRRMSYLCGFDRHSCGTGNWLMLASPHCGKRGGDRCFDLIHFKDRRIARRAIEALNDGNFIEIRRLKPQVLKF